MRMPHQSKPVSRTAGEIAVRGNIAPQFYPACQACLAFCPIGDWGCILYCLTTVCRTP
jgi:hypothetical protein